MPTYKSHYALLISAFTALLVIGFSTQAAAPDVQEIIDDRVEAGLAPAIVVGIVRKDGTKEFYSAGRLNADGTKEVDANTIFEIGSISKVFTTLLMVQMEEQGDLEFSDHAQSFLPAGVTMPTAVIEKTYKLYIVVEGDTLFSIALQQLGSSQMWQEIVALNKINYPNRLSVGDVLRMPDMPVKDGVSQQSGETPPTHITLEHLATHTSGLPKMPSNFRPKDPLNPYADYTYQQMYDFLSSYELQGEIGQEGVYSNLGMGLLGHILELQSGKSYEELLIDRICRPLGMNSTTTKPRSQDAARVAGAHMEVMPVSAWDIPTLAGAGDINSTVSDMLIFTAANMGQIDTPMARAMRRCHLPRVNSANSPIKIGLGWHVLGQPEREIIWHNGGTGGFASFMGFRPDTGEGVVVLSNSSYRGVDQIGYHLLDDGHKLDKLLKLVTIDLRILSDYVGSYSLNPAMQLTIKSENDQLFVMVPGQPFFQVYPTGRDEFSLKVVDAQLSFVRNSEGIVDRLVLHQNGLDQEALKTNGPSPEYEIDPRILSDYVGTYSLSLNAIFTIKIENDQLIAMLTGQPFVPVYPTERDEFAYKVVNATISFVRNSEGKVDRLVLHQNGRDLEALKTDQTSPE